MNSLPTRFWLSRRKGDEDWEVITDAPTAERYQGYPTFEVVECATRDTSVTRPAHRARLALEAAVYQCIEPGGHDPDVIRGFLEEALSAEEVLEGEVA